MTVADIQNLTGVEQAMALDLLDAETVDRLVEDEPTAEDYLHGVDEPVDFSDFPEDFYL